YAPGTPDLWIDPTYEFGRPGQLPADAQGRMALIVKPGSASLVRTPESNASDNTSIEPREFLLAESGAARVVETSNLSGVFEQELRSGYAGMDAVQIRKSLETYVKRFYAAEALSELETPPPYETEQSLHMQLEIKNSRLGVTDRMEASVAIPQALLLLRLSSFAKAFDSDSEFSNGAAKQFVIPQPFITEWRYHISPPPGFTARPLPDPQI